MKLQRLKIFESIARHLNVTAAAEELLLSQPAASLHLKLLEQEYGLTLFKRKSSGMELTEEGRDFLEAVRPILAGIRSVDAKFKNRNPLTPKPKRSSVPATPDVVLVGTNQTLLETALSHALFRFRERWRPEAELVLEIAGSNAIESQVEDFRLDVALISNPKYLPNCEYEEFLETRYEVVAVTARDFPVEQASMTIEELLKQPLVIRAGSTCVEELRRRGYELNSALHCRSPDAARAAISRKLGVGLLLKSWVRSEIERGDMVTIACPELNEMTYQSYIVWNSRKALGGDAQHLIETMRDIRDEARDSRSAH